MEGGVWMSSDLQSKYSKKIKHNQQVKRSEPLVGRVTKLPSGTVESKALRERGNRQNDQ